MDKPRKFCRHSDAAKEVSIIKVITRVFKNKLIPGLREPPCLSLYCPCHSCKEICNYLLKPSLQWSSKIPLQNATIQPQYQIKKNTVNDLNINYILRMVIWLRQKSSYENLLRFYMRSFHHSRNKLTTVLKQHSRQIEKKNQEVGLLSMPPANSTILAKLSGWDMDRSQIIGPHVNTFKWTPY